MPKKTGAHISTNTHLQGSPLLDITSTLNQLLNGTSTQEAQALDYYSLLAKARTGADNTVKKQSQKHAGPKRHRGERGGGFTLRHRMELVEIFRDLRKDTNKKVTATNFHQFVHCPVPRKSIKQWDKEFDKIQFDVAHGRGDKCTLSSNPVDLIRYILDKTVQEWLIEVRKSNSVVSGIQLQAAADSVLHILMDDICDLNDIPPGRPISFTASWRSRMTQECGIAYCRLRGEAASVDTLAIAERMDEIREICSSFELDDIYNCDETGMYLKELSTHSYTMEELASGAKPERGTGSRVSILFCVNASGSSLARAGTVEALRPVVIGKYTNKPCYSMKRVGLAKWRLIISFHCLTL